MAAGSASAERLRSGVKTLAPFCQRRLWKPHVYRPGPTVPMATPNVSPLAICFAIATSSSRLPGTLGRPSAPTRPASFITFTLR